MNFISIGRSLILPRCSSHKHDVWEIELNLSGTGINRVDGENIEFNEGSLLCLPPTLSHAKTANSKFQDTFIHCKSLNIPNQSTYTLLHDDDGSIKTLYSLLYNAFNNEYYNHAVICEQLFLALEQMIIGKLNRKITDPLIEELIEIMQDKFDDPDFSVTTISEYTGYCNDHLRRLFKRSTGMTPLEYLTDIRINNAKKLLSINHNLHYTIAEIGSLCGFDDISYFSRVFKKKMGVPPSEYK